MKLFVATPAAKTSIQRGGLALLGGLLPTGRRRRGWAILTVALFWGFLLGCGGGGSSSGSGGGGGGGTTTVPAVRYKYCYNYGDIRLHQPDCDGAIDGAVV